MTGETARSTILIVEDDADSADLMGQILEIEGYIVRKAHSGPGGLNMAGQPGVDLVLLDVMLPGVDGIEVCRQIRQRASTARLPVVIISARARREDIAIGLQAGANAYMTKPLTRSDLVATVKRLLVDSREKS
ncbi:MAG TPA: response regulator [Anaerolineales bacterium]|nr:response regulator [Anaerolineales bacterium]